jgi:tetratricopeptide (TPR) repeat protein
VEQEIARRPTENPSAYQAYLQGQGLAIFYQKEELDAARGHFQRALAIDPDYALALAGLATVESMYYRQVDAKPEHLAKAAQYAEQAIAIDPNLARAHASLAEVNGVSFRYSEAVEGFREAIRLDPQEPSYHDYLSWALSYMTPPQPVESEEAAREAIRLSPRFAAAYYHLGRALIGQDRIAEAFEAFEYCKSIDRTTNYARLGMGQAYLAKGEYEQAFETFHYLDTPLEMVYRAAAQAGLGRIDEALTSIETAVAGGYRDHAFLGASKYFIALRSKPRFQALLQDTRKPR